MLKVYICEDNEVERVDMASWIRGNIDVSGKDAKLVLASSKPQDILEEARINPKDSSLYFLDIDLEDKNMNGLQLAGAIRKLQPRAMIVIVTTHSELMPMTFYHGIEAMDYIIKDDRDKMKGKVFRVLDLAYDRVNLFKKESGSVFEVSDQDISYLIPVSDIYYFETAGDHKIRLVYKDGVIEYRDKLSRIEEVDESFYRSHNSYVINLKQVSQVIRSEGIVVMNDGSRCLVSTRRMKELNDKLSSLQ